MPPKGKASPSPRTPPVSPGGAKTPPISPDAAVGRKSSPLADDGGSKKAKEEEDRVHVVLRIRPFMYDSEGDITNSALQCDQDKNLVWAYSGEEGDEKSSVSKAPKQYIFDKVLPPDSEQINVYEAAADGVVRSVLQGYTGCVMCYGQTGAGKTFTLANEKQATLGVMPRALQFIFDHIASESSLEFEVQMSYVQIYLDAVSDLLEPTNDVQIREDPKQGVFLTGLSWERIKSPEEARKVLTKGNANRATACTKMNADSSRSHAVMMLEIKCSGGTRTLMGKLYMVDLAGCEKVKRSGVVGDAFDEAVAINQSLTILGRCIEAMADQKKGGRPPFRESKLTRLLSNAIGGNAKTTLIVCVAPSKRDIIETSNSLDFGQQAMNVVVRAKVNSSVDYTALSSQLLGQRDVKQAPLHALEMKVLAKLSVELDRVLELEKQAKTNDLQIQEVKRQGEKHAAQAAQITKAEKEAKAGDKAKMLELEEEHVAATKELEKVMFELEDNQELREMRQTHESDMAALNKQLGELKKEKEAKEAEAAKLLAEKGDKTAQVLPSVISDLEALARQLQDEDMNDDAASILDMQQRMQLLLAPAAAS